MKTLYIPETKGSPEIHLNEDLGIFRIAGVSTLVNAPEFYKPIIDWVQSELPQSTSAIRFEINLPYFNSSTNKCIFNLIDRIQRTSNDAQRHVIVWYVEEEDEFMRESGESIAELINIPFEYVVRVIPA